MHQNTCLMKLMINWIIQASRFWFYKTPWSFSSSSGTHWRRSGWRRLAWSRSQPCPKEWRTSSCGRNGLLLPLKKGNVFFPFHNIHINMFVNVIMNFGVVMNLISLNSRLTYMAENVGHFPMNPHVCLLDGLLVSPSVG